MTERRPRRSPKPLAVVVSAGRASQDASRVSALLSGAPTHRLRIVYVDKERTRPHAFLELLRTLRKADPVAIFLEGTGIVSGLATMVAAAILRVPYVVSSGDPIAGFVTNRYGPVLGALAGIYERALLRRSYAFVGWTPYLVGRALDIGAARTFTLVGAVDTTTWRPVASEVRAKTRASWGADEDDLIIGVVGSLTWNPRQRYTYGLELVNAAKHLRRMDVVFVIIGDGTGASPLQAAANGLDARFRFLGRVDHSRLPELVGSFDVAMVTQTTDRLGSYRLTTKLPEYLAVGTPVAMSDIPGFWDFCGPEAGWVLPPGHPGSEQFGRELAEWIDTLDLAEARSRREAARHKAETLFATEDAGTKLQKWLQAHGLWPNE